MIKISSTAAPKRTADYSILKTGTDLGREQLECLDLLLDPYSHGSLTSAGIREGLIAWRSVPVPAASPDGWLTGYAPVAESSQSASTPVA